MSDNCQCRDSKSSFGGTLTAGIQDIAALLPLIGTDQCEKHLGSALDGGFFYAAATSLSTFGTPGIVKHGISVLIASISFPVLTYSHFPRLRPLTGTQWHGAKILKNAGIEPVGTVALMIAMDGERYVAESRLLRLLDEKHINNPESLTIEFSRLEWNICLMICTSFVVAISSLFYWSLLRNGSTPVLDLRYARPLGSLFASTLPQFLIQHRIISILRYRILFMRIHRQLVRKLRAKNIANPELLLHDQKYFRWGAHLTAEECLSSLEAYLMSLTARPNLSSTPQSSVPSGPSVPSPSPSFSNIAIPMQTPDDILNIVLLETLQTKRWSLFFPRLIAAILHVSMMLILFLALPAIVIGYIGSFMLVSNRNFNRPLIWLGVEAGLALVRMLVWAWNPTFDEETQVTVRLKLTDEEPIVTTEKDVHHLKGVLPLVSEQRFLQLITRFTGPLEEFKSVDSEHIALYFTLSGHNGMKYLYMTLFDTDKRTAFVLHKIDGKMMWRNALVDVDPDRMEMQAKMLSEISDTHPWRVGNHVLPEQLLHYYDSLLRALNRRDPEPRQPLAPLFGNYVVSTYRGWSERGIPLLSAMSSYIATTYSFLTRGSIPPSSTAISLKWSLVAKPPKETPILASPMPRPLTSRDEKYLERGTEHQLKSQLIENSGSWIVYGMAAMRRDALCRINPSQIQEDGGKSRSKSDALETWVSMAWTQDESTLLATSLQLEETLHSRMENVISTIVGEREEEGLADQFRLDFSVGRKRRLEHEMELANTRMEKAAEERIVFAGNELIGSWDETGGMVFESGRATPPASEPITRESPLAGIAGEINERMKLIKTADLSAYKFPKCYISLATAVYSGFARLSELPHEGGLVASKLSGAIVCDVLDCHPDVVHTVFQNPSARSVINTPKDLILENEYSLYISDISGDEIEVNFVRDNRERWWMTHQESNASTFYFTPTEIDNGAWIRGKGRVACLMIFIDTPTRIRITLSHHRAGYTALSVQYRGEPLARVGNDQIPVADYGSHSLVLDPVFERGRHELNLVVTQGSYALYDIVVDFTEDFLSTPLWR